MSTIAQEFIQQGIEQGIEQSILRVLRRRFGETPQDVRARLDRLAVSELETLLDEALMASDLADFDARLTAVSAKTNE